MDFGYFTLSDNHYTHNSRTANQLIADIIDEALYAEQLGMHSVWIGEHNSLGVLSCPDLVLATIAAQTRRVRLAPAVTVLPLHHPMRVAEQWATLDLLSPRFRASRSRPSMGSSPPYTGERETDDRRKALSTLRHPPHRVAWSVGSFCHNCRLQWDCPVPASEARASGSRATLVETAAHSFSPSELMRLGHYREAFRHGLYTDWPAVAETRKSA